jgi:hypothetical protein
LVCLQQKKCNSGINFPEASFHALSQDEVKKIIMKAPAKSCELGSIAYLAS